MNANAQRFDFTFFAIRARFVQSMMSQELHDDLSASCSPYVAAEASHLEPSVKLAIESTVSRSIGSMTDYLTQVIEFRLKIFPVLFPKRMVLSWNKRLRRLAEKVIRENKKGTSSNLITNWKFLINSTGPRYTQEQLFG